MSLGCCSSPVFLQALWELAARARGRHRQHSETVLCWCAWLTVATFTFVKVTPWGGWLYSMGLGALRAAPAALDALLQGEMRQLPRVRLVQDSTDLCALPAALFDWRWSARAARRHGGTHSLPHGPAFKVHALTGSPWSTTGSLPVVTPASRRQGRTQSILGASSGS